MELTLTHVFVIVEDQDKALTFYRDVIGLELRTDANFEEFRWITVGPASQPEIEIVLAPVGMGHPRDEAALRVLLAKGSLSGLIFATDSCDATFERIRAAGAEVLQEPIDQPYGIRDCAFRDPFGNMIRFSQRIGG